MGRCQTIQMQDVAGRLLTSIKLAFSTLLLLQSALSCGLAMRYVSDAVDSQCLCKSLPWLGNSKHVLQGKRSIALFQIGDTQSQFPSCCGSQLIMYHCKFCQQPVKRHSRKSLRVLGSVGEPINPSAWRQGTINPSSIYLPPGCISLLVCPIHTTSVRMDHIAKQLAVTRENIE